MMETKLLNAYREIFKNKNNEPDWAVHKHEVEHTNKLVHCSIPFVGEKYTEQKTKILMYASAENLSGYCGHLDNDDYAINRHRHKFEETAGKENYYFPNVHIAPIEDGCLAIVALYVLAKFQHLDEITPEKFFEMISFGNFCKYTIESDTNKDYVGSKKKVSESYEYIEKDFEVLKPDYVIMPKTIYDRNRKFIDSIKGESKIIPIYQINAGNINRIIKKNYPIDKSSRDEYVATLDKNIQRWYDELKSNGITGKTKENYLGVFAYIDDVLKKNNILG